MARLFIYPPVAVSVTVPPIAYTNGGVNTPVTPQTPLPVKLTAAPLDFVRIDMASTNITTAAYLEAFSSVGSTAVKRMQIFLSSGTPILLAFGAASSEVDQKIIVPGENICYDFDIPASTRVSLKAIGTNITSGQLIINLFG
jgi:hypothetical protein